MLGDVTGGDRAGGVHGRLHSGRGYLAERVAAPGSLALPFLWQDAAGAGPGSRAYLSRALLERLRCRSGAFDPGAGSPALNGDIRSTWARLGRHGVGSRVRGGREGRGGRGLESP